MHRYAPVLYKLRSIRLMKFASAILQLSRSLRSRASRSTRADGSARAKAATLIVCDGPSGARARAAWPSHGRSRHPPQTDPMQRSCAGRADRAPSRYRILQRPACWFARALQSAIHGARWRALGDGGWCARGSPSARGCRRGSFAGARGAAPRQWHHVDGMSLSVAAVRTCCKQLPSARYQRSWVDLGRLAAAVL